MHSRIPYIHDHLYSRAWYLAQALPPPGDCIRQLTTTISYFLWQGDLFRVPITTIQREKSQGGWDLLNILAKCRSILIIRLQKQLQATNSLAASWLTEWDVTTRGTYQPTTLQAHNASPRLPNDLHAGNCLHTIQGGDRVNTALQAKGLPNHTLLSTVAHRTPLDAHTTNSPTCQLEGTLEQPTLHAYTPGTESVLVQNHSRLSIHQCEVTQNQHVAHGRLQTLRRTRYPSTQNITMRFGKDAMELDGHENSRHTPH
jgi:hypothetical protein